MKVIASALDRTMDSEAAAEAQFADLVDRHARFVFRVAYTRLRSVAESEDVVQETFLKLLRNGAWKRMKDERAFLARTAWRLAGDRLSQRKRLEEVPEIADSAAGPESAAIASNEDALLRRIVDGLPEEFRTPLLLSSLQDLTSKEIAEMLGVPEGTVRRRVQRARQLVRLKLAALEDKRC